MVVLENRAGLSNGAFARLDLAVRGHTSMKHALDWLLSHDPPLTFNDVIPQDEYSHDILIAYRDELWLVYDST